MMTAHVGDFGISRLMISPHARDDSTAAASGDTSSLLVGSIGYIAPEYGTGGRPSTKGDVYNYGILLLETDVYNYGIIWLETITGKKPTDLVFSEEGQSLQSWVGNAFPDRLLEVIDGNLVEEIRKRGDRLLEVTDGNLVEEIRKEEDDEEEESHDISEIMGYRIVVLLANIGMLCTKWDPHERPTLQEVEASLEQLVAKIHKSAENGLNRFGQVRDQSISESD